MPLCPVFRMSLLYFPNLPLKVTQQRPHTTQQLSIRISTITHSASYQPIICPLLDLAAFLIRIKICPEVHPDLIAFILSDWRLPFPKWFQYSIFVIFFFWHFNIISDFKTFIHTLSLSFESLWIIWKTQIKSPISLFLDVCLPRI